MTRRTDGLPPSAVSRGRRGPGSTIVSVALAVGGVACGALVAQVGVWAVAVVALVLLMGVASRRDPDGIVAVALLAGVMMTRPTVFGLSINTAGIVVSAVVAGWVLFAVRRGSIGDGQIWVAGFLIALPWLYLPLYAGLVNSARMDFVVKAMVSNLVVVASAVAVLSHQRIARWFLRAWVALLAFAALSFLVTVVLMLVFSASQLEIARVPSPGYGALGQAVLAPLTPVYAFMTAGPFTLPRLSGWFGESGAYQAFCIWALLLSVNYGVGGRWTRILLGVGAVAALSTAGIALLPACLGLQAVFSRRGSHTVVRVAVAAVLLVAASVALFAAPVVGLNAKSVVYAVSAQDRVDATLTGIRELLHNPMGTGVYSSGGSDPTEHNSGINLLAASAQVGIPGVVLIVVAYATPIILARRRGSALSCVLPLFFTALFAQPLVDAPLVYVALLATCTADRWYEPARAADPAFAVQAEEGS